MSGYFLTGSQRSVSTKHLLIFRVCTVSSLSCTTDWYQFWRNIHNFTHHFFFMIQNRTKIDALNFVVNTVVIQYCVYYEIQCIRRYIPTQKYVEIWYRYSIWVQENSTLFWTDVLLTPSNNIIVPSDSSIYLYFWCLCFSSCLKLKLDLFLIYQKIIRVFLLLFGILFRLRTATGSLLTLIGMSYNSKKVLIFGAI